jgi:hypothetical protein
MIFIYVERLVEDTHALKPGGAQFSAVDRVEIERLMGLHSCCVTGSHMDRTGETMGGAIIMDTIFGSRVV